MLGHDFRVETDAEERERVASTEFRAGEMFRTVHGEFKVKHLTADAERALRDDASRVHGYATDTVRMLLAALDAEREKAAALRTLALVTGEMLDEARYEGVTY